MIIERKQSCRSQKLLTERAPGKVVFSKHSHTCQPSWFYRDCPDLQLSKQAKIGTTRFSFFFFFFKGKNRHRPCLDLQYINFKYENCVSLAFKIAKIQGLCRWTLLGAGAAPGPPAIGCPDFEYPNVGRYAFNNYSFNFSGGLCSLTDFCLWCTPNLVGEQFLWCLKNYLLWFHCIFLLFDTS